MVQIFFLLILRESTYETTAFHVFLEAISNPDKLIKGIVSGKYTDDWLLHVKKHLCQKDQ